MDWAAKMFVAATAGAMAGLFWPLLIAAWRQQTEGYFHLSVVGRALNPVVRWILRFVLLLILGAVISIIATAVGFFAFLQNEEQRRTLQAMGAFAYFSAFSYGFSAAALVSEPLKKPG